MSAIVVLIGFSLAVATGFLIAFLWAVKSGQYDDKYTPSVRILFDDSSPSLSVGGQKKSFQVESKNSIKETSEKSIKFNRTDSKPLSNKKSNTQIKHTNN